MASELTEKQKEDLKYLRSLDRIIIPKEFTYWCHNTMYKPLEDCVNESDKRCWNEIPTSEFTLKKEMSFVTRMQRVQTALDYDNLPSTGYANTKGSLPFQIRVLQAKQKYIKDVYEDDSLRRAHYYWDRGLGDGRHPKLPSKRELFVFAFATKDDVSNQDIDIIYCVDKDDISLIADLVRKIPNTQFNTNLIVTNKRAQEADIPTVIAKSNNRFRFFDMSIVDENKVCQLTIKAGYKEDYEKMKMKDKKIK